MGYTKLSKVNLSAWAAKTAFLVATSGGIDPSGQTFMVLHWKPAPEVVGYNLYRAEAGTGTPTQICVNGTSPITSVRTCADLKAIIPEGSAEWQMLVDAFSAMSVRDELKIVKDAAGRPHLMLGPDYSMISGPASLATTVKTKQIIGTTDLCAAIEAGLTDKQAAIFDVVAAANLKMRLARGLAYIDKTVQAGQEYVYELRGVLPGGGEVSLAKDRAKAGYIVLIGPPSGFDATAGDHMVLTTWNRNNWAFSYAVRRATQPLGPYQLVTAKPIVYNIERDLDDQPLTPPRPGFVDFQYWDDQGKPVDHEVDGAMIEGPTNGVTYYYQVASRDILDRTGAWSGAKSATPADKTPPMAPVDFRVDPSTSPLGMALAWRKVTRDVRGHQELDVTQSYRIFRADTYDALTDLTAPSAHLVATLTANPTDTTMTLTWIDTDVATLIPPYGEKDFWYRVQCVDAKGNVGLPSAILSGRIPDTRPPGPTTATGSRGYADHITVTWDANSEPDLAGYQVYRGICDRGELYQPSPQKETQEPCDFVLVGDVSVKEAENRLEASGAIYFDDFSVPLGSPLCYAYWIRAYDKSANLYAGSHGCPASDSEYICQRLYEEVPPPVPIVTALKARSNAVLIEWIASPVQDLHAFHIYRSEREGDPPDFVGCVLADGTPYNGKWQGMKPHCKEIPAEPDPNTVHGSFLDKDVEPNRVYWYRVSALDWLGNESEGKKLTAIPAISTFTYSRDLLPMPTLLSPAAAVPEGCGLLIRWDPPFDPGQHEGFLVFRSAKVNGVYRQVSPAVKGNSYSDASALRGTDYWYRVQAIDKHGKLSGASMPVKHRY